jgi:hypothetical protein
MTVRNLETRIVKLEAARRHEDQMLVIWRRPDGNVTEAVAGTTFAHRNLRPTFDEVEEDYVTRSIDRIVEAQDRPKGFAPPPAVDQSYLGKLTDGEVLHMLLGVQS